MRSAIPSIVLAWLAVSLIAVAQEGSSKPPAEAGKKAAPAAPPSARRKGKADENPRVMTPQEIETRRKSPFLRPPGAGDDEHYEPEDLRDLPPWSYASFFGISARGRFVVYVLDQSGSMIDDSRMVRATSELRRSVNALHSPQKFEVIFYNDVATTMPGGPTLRDADQRTKEQLRNWLQLIDPDGGTSPKRAVLQALGMRPDAVFLLSDGDFPEGTVEAIAAANGRKVPIHCVDLAGGLAGDALQKIARESGGRYASRPGSLQDVGSGR